MRSLLVTLPDQLHMAWLGILAKLECSLLALVDRYLRRRGEERVPVLLDFEDIPVLYDLEDFGTVQSENDSWWQ